ncbi:alpha-2-macroglobulin receptor-associated protein isoform X1 [Lethenteron reissneri]|uniref:alpha-2-macroglobulin receptor-associated protein isoform X1 n=1 Tax=Lethenteron reissneri TaxID=7753 RepID=UPI002AB7069F|nr:alpha-2-macroglobulin receptor-associated protein isoform X1 [Lethenteron reissneri]
MRARDAGAMRFVAMALVMVACASCGADVSPGEFRVAKIEQAWNKAQRIQLSAVQLSDLHGELRMLERQELSVKRDGHVEEQQTEQLNRNLLAVLARYGLDGGKKENFGLNSNRLMEFGDSKPFRDPKLNKMWEKARASGRFENAGDLQRLERDFHLHDERIQEYEAMVIQSTGHNMNTVDGAGIPDKQLKEVRSKLHNSLQRLRELMSMGYVNSEFTEPVAMELWEMAQQANLSEKELHDVKEELLTLERISEKHSHFREQLQVSHEKLQHAKATYDDVPFDKTAQDSKRENVKLSHDVDRLGETQRRHNELTDKTRSLAYKVKKLHQDLSTRLSRPINRQHNEL